MLELKYAHSKLLQMDTIAYEKRHIFMDWIGTLPPINPLETSVLSRLDPILRKDIEAIESLYQSLYVRDTVFFQYCAAELYKEDAGREGVQQSRQLIALIYKLKGKRESFLKMHLSTSQTPNNIKESTGLLQVFAILKQQEQFIKETEANLSREFPREVNILRFEAHGNALQLALDTMNTLGLDDDLSKKLLKKISQWIGKMKFADRLFGAGNQQYDAFQRSQYWTMVLNFNQSIALYNELATMQSLKLYPSAVPTWYKKNKKIITERAITPVFKTNVLSGFEKKERKDLNEAEIAFLNQVVLEVNFNIKAANVFSSNMWAYNEELNKVKRSKWWEMKGQQGPAFEFHSGIRMDSLLKLREQAKQVFPAYADQINGHLDATIAWIKNSQQLGYELVGHSINQPYYKGDFNRSDVIFKGSKEHFESFGAMCAAHYQFLTVLMDQHTKENNVNPWDRTARKMLEVCNGFRVPLADMKAVIFDMEHGVDTQPAKTTLLQYLDGMDANLDGILRMPSNRSNNADYLYKRIGDSGAYLEKQLTKLNNVSDNNRYGSTTAIYSGTYNSRFRIMADAYNDFVDMAAGKNFKRAGEEGRPIYLLYTFYECNLNKMKIVPLKFKEEVQAVAKDKNWNKSTVQTDTVFIERVVRDTVFVHNSLLEGQPFNNMVFLLDVSGSMENKHKLPMLKKAMVYLTEQMRWQDEIAVVTYAGSAAVVLSPTSAKDSKKISKSIKKLKPSGKTHLNKGLSLAYNVANKNYKRKGNNKVILATDGALEGIKKLEPIVKKYAALDIRLSILSFGKINSDMDRNLNRLAKIGGGQHTHISENNADATLLQEALK